MAKTILVCGFGPGISTAVAETFGGEGFSVALVARSGDRLAAGVKALEAKGIKAAAFIADLSDPEAIRALVPRVRAAFGPITIVQWSAYASGARDLLVASSSEIRKHLDVAVAGLLAVTQETLSDLRNEKGGLLVTNGALGYFDPSIDAYAIRGGAMGLAIANSAKHKMVGLLSQQLAADGVYVGEVVVAGSVKGSAFDDGSATLEPADIAKKFWELYSARKEVSIKFP